MMNIGRDDAHAEAILAKIYIEQGKRFQSRWLLERAERIARTAGNRVKQIILGSQSALTAVTEKQCNHNKRETEWQASGDDACELNQFRRALAHTNEEDQKWLLRMVQKMAGVSRTR